MGLDGYVTPRFLVADDDITVRQLVSTFVRREGYAIDAVSDGEDAIERLRTGEYAVILLDLMMPRMDGFAVIDYLKTHPLPRKPLVLVITAYADQRFKDVDPAVVSGIVRKPFEIADLANIIALCVETTGLTTPTPIDLARDEGKHAH